MNKAVNNLIQVKIPHPVKGGDRGGFFL